MASQMDYSSEIQTHLHTNRTNNELAGVSCYISGTPSIDESDKNLRCK